MSTIANPSGLSLSCHRVYTYTVPPEIISLIVEEFALPTYIVTRNNNGKKVKDPLPLPPPLRPILCKIRLLSKSFNDAASRLLFRRMVSKSGPLHFAFLRTIINSPHLAKYVRIYHTPTADVRSGHVYGRIKKCLPLMTGLQELVYRKLEIPRDLSRSKPLPRHLPKVKKGKNMPFRLRSFVWFSERTRPDEDVQALEFIATQASMQYLRWDSTRPLPSIHKDTIPQNLLYLDASVDTIVTILPGRPSIEGIRWRSHDRAILDHYSTADINELIRKLCRMEQFHRLSFISLAGNYERSALKYLREQNAEPFPQLTTLALLTIDSSIVSVVQVYLDSDLRHN
ncbi:hypothetical protein CVT25_002596 [Psilocybe cyanescens]|uniref:F-box domain-containing protein n=1 Tax=Psilocybe cyanescens TaxID=93625 RepID=A0A409XQU0_PSICY|nr:hypothetical protein CVT25_002596 [Psilocybe cyanescens]